MNGLGQDRRMFIGLILIAGLLLFYFSSPQLLSAWRPRRLATVQPGYFHFWTFKGYTTKEHIEGPSYTIDEVNFPVETKIDEIVPACKIAVITEVTQQLIDQFQEKGYIVTVHSVYPTVRVETRWETRQFRDYEVITLYHTLYIDVDVQFETDKPLAESPVAAWVLVILGMILNKLPAIILATIVGLGIYVGIQTWANSFFVNESIIEIEYYDEEGNLVKRETKYQKGTNWQATLWMIVTTVTCGIVAIVFIAPGIVGGRRRKRR